MIDFSEENIKRYSRHILLPEIGLDGQEKIFNAKILIVGLGGLGSPVALYLAAAGIGTIGLIDGDKVDLTNLQRQIIHTTDDLNRKKTDSAAEKIKKINPQTNIIIHDGLLNVENAIEIIKNYDFIIDGTDNFPVKYLINDACVMANKAFSHGGILRFHGQTFTHVPGSACLRCIFKQPPENAPTCAEAGILGAIPGMLGTIQAAEALKFVTQTGELLTNRLLTFDAKNMIFNNIKFSKQEKCPICSDNPEIKTLFEYQQKGCSLK